VYTSLIYLHIPKLPPLIPPCKGELEIQFPPLAIFEGTLRVRDRALRHFTRNKGVFVKNLPYHSVSLQNAYVFSWFFAANYKHKTVDITQTR
jgi:hypothetical protein